MKNGRGDLGLLGDRLCTYGLGLSGARILGKERDLDRRCLRGDRERCRERDLCRGDRDLCTGCLRLLSLDLDRVLRRCLGFDIERDRDLRLTLFRDRDLDLDLDLPLEPDGDEDLDLELEKLDQEEWLLERDDLLRDGEGFLCFGLRLYSISSCANASMGSSFLGSSCL